MKTKTVRKMLRTKFEDWVSSIKDESLRNTLAGKCFVTGGSIASMLLKEPVNDFDIYFRDLETATSVAKYYVALFNELHGHKLKVEVTEEGRVRVVTESGHRGETLGEPPAIEDAYEETKAQALETEGSDYRPVFVSTNAITLAGKVQLVLRFYGEPDQVHENYDFVHCTNYWLATEDKLVLQQEALETLLTKELRYIGSRYPVCSVTRIRKFIQRGWTINAGQILKMCMQISELDLTDPKVLEDQLTGVDSAYFIQVIRAVKEKDPEKINAAYLVEIIDRMF